MKMICLAAALSCASCAKESKQDPTPTAAPSAPQSETKPVVSRADPVKPTPESVAVKESDLSGCSTAVMPGSDHNLVMTTELSTGRRLIDFVSPDDRELHVIALYITAPNDDIPTFKNAFKFKGTPYWMVAVEQPFQSYFQLPVVVGAVEGKAIDVTKNYKGLEGGKMLTSLTAPTCVKVTVVTFEEEAEQPFKSSMYQLGYKP